MHSFHEMLEQKGILVADGAWATEFVKNGLEPGEPPERWNLDRPDHVRNLAAAYVRAGADIVLTNTFGGSPLKLEKSGLIGKVEDVNRRGVELSMQAADGRALVFASMGPSGEFMAPLGTVGEDQMYEQFSRQAEALADADPDGIVIETMTDLGEARAALRAARDTTDLPVVVSMSFSSGPKGYATMMGVTPCQAAEELETAGAAVVGTNCGFGIAEMVGVAELMRDATSLPLWCKPNAGMPQIVDGETVYRQTPEEMIEHVSALIEAGASIIGGCCGTTPEHIQLLSTERARLVREMDGQN